MIVFAAIAAPAFAFMAAATCAAFTMQALAYARAGGRAPYYRAWARERAAGAVMSACVTAVSGAVAFYAWAAVS